MKSWPIVAALLLVPGIALAQQATRIIPLDQQDAIINYTLENFWGKGVDRNNKPIEPDSEADRKTLPIPRAEAYKVVDFAAYSAVAEWCGLDWKERFLLYMKLRRDRKEESDKQLAFAGVLHGAAQQYVLKAEEGKTCPAKTRDNIKEVFAKETTQLKQLTGNK